MYKILSIHHLFLKELNYLLLQNGWWNFRWKLEEASEQDVHLQLPGGGELLPPHDQLPGVQGHGTPWTSLLLRKNSRVSTVWKEVIISSFLAYITSRESLFRREKMCSLSFSLFFSLCILDLVMSQVFKYTLEMSYKNYFL